VPESEEAVEQDGRIARGERMKEAILRTTMAMVKEGNLIPSAQQISARAGVAIRSVFRHFDDMENLHIAFDQMLQDDLQKEYPGGIPSVEPDAPLSERITRLIEFRSFIWEHHENIILSTQAQFWRSRALRKNYARHQSNLRQELDEWLPELKDFDRTARESANAIISFEMWNRLRRHQGLGKAQATKVIASMLNSVFDH
jgi:AcrR family transcriptional regulator